MLCTRSGTCVLPSLIGDIPHPAHEIIIVTKHAYGPLSRFTAEIPYAAMMSAFAIPWS